MRIKIPNASAILILYFLLFSINTAKAQINRINEEGTARTLSLQNDSVKVDSLLKFYKNLFANDDLKTATANFDNAISLSQKTKNKIAEIEFHSLIGNLYKNHGEFANALKHHFRALEIATAIKKPKNIAISYGNIGSTYKEQTNFIAATNYQLKAMHIYEDLSDSIGVAKTLMNLGVLCKNQGKNEEAIAYYTNAETLYTKLNKNDGKAAVLSNKAVAYSELGKNDSAYRSIKESMEILSKTDKKKLYLTNLTILGNILLSLGSEAEMQNNLTLSDRYYSEAETILLQAIENENEYSRAMNLINYGVLLTIKNRYDEAKTRLEEGLGLFQKTQSKKYIPNTYLRLSMLDSTMAADTSFSIPTRLYHAEQSLNYLKLSYKAQSELVNEDNNKQIAELKIQYETDKKDNEINLLNKENELKDIILKEQISALLISKLRDEKNRKEIELLNKSRAIASLQLEGAKKDLEKQQLKSKSASFELKLSKQEKDLKSNELSEEKLLRGITTGGSLAVLLMGLLLFNRFKLRRQLEHKEAILNQRKAISADLHDDVGSTLSSISIYSEAIKNKLTHNETEKVMDLVNKIGENARETISNLSDIVWSINPVNDSGEVIFNRMETLASSLFSSKGIKLDFKNDESLNHLNYSIEMKQNLFLIFKEAINNCAKYSQATHVNVDIRKNGKMMNMTISDNGVGFDTKSTSTGNGLRNMRERAKLLNGTISIQSLGKGTTIELNMPLHS